MSFGPLVGKSVEMKPTPPEGGRVRFDPDKRVDVKESREYFHKSENIFNPDKRMDLKESREYSHKNESIFDPDKRMEIQRTSDTKEGGYASVEKGGSYREEGISDFDEGAKEGLTDEEKAKIKEETGWSDEIIDAIGSWKEYEIYKNAGLVEAEIDGKKCLIRNDIDWDQKDAMGRTNKERAEQGLSPINKDGKAIELHHIGQHADSPLAELTQEEHRGKGNDTILHDKTKESEIDRQAFAGERSDHWAARAQESEV